ncbi:MAG: HD domain-containing protein, partial [Anaerolineae bacterium]|nr:HD domain-containing protein [Anaerolineae bacterium]
MNTLPQNKAMPEKPPSVPGSQDPHHPYAGRWVARVGQRVVGQGGTPLQALQAAQAARFKEKPQVSYVPTSNQLIFSPLLEQVQAALPAKASVYLVGGAVRDALLQRASHDLDFTLPKEALKIARRVANKLGGAYYRMDDEHQTGRVVLTQEDGLRQVLDFAAMRGPDLESDLRGRDFTINAIAVDIRQPQTILDPLGGMADLLAKRVRACSPTAFQDDPVRILRAVRFAAAYRMQIVPETRQSMRQNVTGIENTSPERRRDELFRMLANPQPAASLRALEMLGVLPFVLPELAALKGVTQSPPHVSDVWEHTLHTVQHLESLLAALDEHYDQKTANQLVMGLVVLRLGRYRQQISAHLSSCLTRERGLRPLLFLAALYHDVAKPPTRSVDEDGRIRFLDHENRGAKTAAARASALHLSNLENQHLSTIIRHHMRPLHLANAPMPPSRRAVYRFFRDTGAAGIDVCLLSLADLLATYQKTLPQETLAAHLDVLRTLLEAYWEQAEERLFPPALLDGKDLIKEFDLKPGPRIGALLEALREAQAAGEVASRGDALQFAETWLGVNA